MYINRLTMGIMGRPTEKIAEEKIREIVKLYQETDLNKKEIASQLNTSYKKVNQTLKDLKIPKKKNKSSPRGKSKGKIKIDLKKVKELREELYDYKDIAKMLDISPTTLGLRIKESNNFEDCRLIPNKKLAGKVQEVLKLYKEKGSITEVSNKFNVNKKSIRRLLIYKGIELPGKGNRINHTKIINKGKQYSNHWLYSTWKGIKQRCYSPHNNSYKNYGAKGITIYSEWKNDFNEFKKYVEKNLGKKKAQMSLDRINSKGNYEPGNIRWADKTTQTYNRANCFERDLNTIDTTEVLKDKELNIKYYSIEELQIQKEIEELKKAGVYIIKCVSNNSYYIGSTTRSFRERWREIRKHCKNDNRRISLYLRRFWKECNGEQNFKFGILEETENTLEREQYWVNKLQPNLNIVKDIL